MGKHLGLILISDLELIIIGDKVCTLRFEPRSLQDWSGNGPVHLVAAGVHQARRR